MRVVRLAALAFNFCILFTLAACVVGPEYTQPEIAAPDHFVSQEVFNNISQGQVTKEESTETLPLNWWEGFSDPLLSQLVEDTLKKNYTISSAAARLKEAGARLNLVDSRDEITADVNVDADVQEDVEFGERDDSTSSGSLFGIMSFVWPLDVFGQTKRQIEAARASLQGASAELRSTILSVSAEVASEYLRLRGNQRQLYLLEESVALQEQTLSIVRSRFNAGLAPELDLRRAEAAVANLRADIPALEESLINSRNNLASLTGEFPGALNKLLMEEENIPTYQGDIPDLVPLDVLSMRPDVQQAETELKRAVAEIGVAKAEYYPIFQLGKQIGIGTTGVSGEPAVGVLIGSLSALIQQVVIDGGARRANFNIAFARAEEALANYKQVLLNAIEEVETTLAALQSSLDRQESLTRAVEASDRSFYQAEILYRQGLTSFLDVVDAQRVLAAAQQQLASAKTNFASQIANLFRVLGTEIQL